MINSTDNVELTVLGSNLHDHIRVAGTQSLIDLKTEGAKGVDVFKRFHDGTSRPLDADFLTAAFSFCQGDSRHHGTRKSIETLAQSGTLEGRSSAALAHLRRGLKLVLVRLWSNGLLLLPTIFTTGPHFPFHLFENELLEWVRSIAAPEGTARKAKSSEHRLRNYGPRLLLATNWRKPEDVSLREIAALHLAQNEYRMGTSGVIIAGGTQLPLTLFASRLLRDFPDRVQYSNDALNLYSVWTLSRSKAEFGPDEQPPDKKRARRRARPKQVKPTASMMPAYGAAVTGNTHQSLLDAYRALQRGRPPSVDWREAALPSYPGREHVDLSSIGPAWIESFRAFLHHRSRIQGFRSSDDTVSALNLLADYLFFYLPWWAYLYPSGRVQIPASPKAFQRFAFVARHALVDIAELPAPLLDLIALRRPSRDSASVAVHQLTRYFKYVGTHFADDARIAGPEFRSPMDDAFDAPRVKRRSKTTKEVIPKHLYGHLLFYCYAVEDFGRHLQRMALTRPLARSRKKLSNAECFDPLTFGSAPKVRYRGTELLLETVPNAFSWFERRVTDRATAYLPHLTALRLLITSLETGLRCQSVQWLDRRTWDQSNADAPPGTYIFALRVNTDKTKSHEWTTYIVHRVRALLQRENDFQESCLDAADREPVNYEGLSDSPFATISPLFRSATGSRPIGDHAYRAVWTVLLAAFERHYAQAVGQKIQLVRAQPRFNTDGTPVVRFRDPKGEGPYCALSLLPVHTPHACRATFATHRQGVLELSDVAELLGHQSDYVTAYYTKPSEHDLRLRLQESDRSALSDFQLFDERSAGYIRADQADSALVTSFFKDRAGTVDRFKFMPSIGIWATNEVGTAAEKLFIEGPMSRIRFRETHVCPVGEECPSDVVQKLGAPRRCGACPLALKCIDHLPAIAAKKNELLERIRYSQQRRRFLEEAGEPITTLDEVWETIELDANEFLGWQLSEEILESLRQKRLDSAGDASFHVDQPEIVRRHLERVTRKSGAAEFVLRRIADCNAYPSLETPAIGAAASRLKRTLLAGGLATATSAATEANDVRATARLLSILMQTTGQTMPQVSHLLEAEVLTCWSIFGPVETLRQWSFGKRGNHEEGPIYGRADGQDPARRRRSAGVRSGQEERRQRGHDLRLAQALRPT